MSERIREARRLVSVAKKNLANVLREEFPVGVVITYRFGASLYRGTVVDHDEGRFLVELGITRHWTTYNSSFRALVGGG